MGHKEDVAGCFLNPFSDYQLYSYSHDGELRLWDLQDFICVKVIRIPGAIDYFSIVAHPTRPNVLFALLIHRFYSRRFYFL